MRLSLFKSQAALNDAVAFVEVWSVKPDDGISFHDKKPQGRWGGNYRNSRRPGALAINSETVKTSAANSSSAVMSSKSLD